MVRWLRLGAESCSGNYFQIWLKVNTGIVPVLYAGHTMVEDHKSAKSKQKSEPKFAYFGAGGQTWTGTVVTPQDFKSCASADSATPAYWRHHSDSNWGIRVLQTRALPLGYGAIFKRQWYYNIRIYSSKVFVWKFWNIFLNFYYSILVYLWYYSIFCEWCVG